MSALPDTSTGEQGSGGAGKEPRLGTAPTWSQISSGSHNSFNSSGFQQSQKKWTNFLPYPNSCLDNLVRSHSLTRPRAWEFTVTGWSWSQNKALSRD